jgi:hypothetical protein
VQHHLMSFFSKIFETICEHVPRNKLHGSTNFIIFGPTHQKLWEIENVSVGQASARAN